MTENDGRAPFVVGDRVRKNSGYTFEGEVRSVYTNKKGEWRVVVEMVNEGNGNGMQHIFSPVQLDLVVRNKEAWDWRDTFYT